MSDSTDAQTPEFRRGLGLFDSVMIVTGIMIGSGIFKVEAPRRPESMYTI